MRYLALIICLVMNLAGLLLAGKAQYERYETSQALLMLTYLPFAGLISPVLFIVAIIQAPRGTFRFGWPAGDEVVERYRLLFWGNLVLVVFVFFALSKLSWKMGS